MNLLTLWILVGITMLVIEMLTGSFVLLFISLGAFFAALVAAFIPDGISVQLLTCAGVSLVGAFTLRKPLQRKLLKSAAVEADVGKDILIDQNMAPKQQTRITYQGTTWEAINVGDEEIRQGDQVKIVGIDSTILLLRKI